MRTLESLRHTSLEIPTVVNNTPSVPPARLVDRGQVLHLESQIQPNEKFNNALSTPSLPTYSYYFRSENYNPERQMSSIFKLFREDQLQEKVVHEKAVPLTVNTPSFLLA